MIDHAQGLGTGEQRRITERPDVWVSQHPHRNVGGTPRPNSGLLHEQAAQLFGVHPRVNSELPSGHRAGDGANGIDRLRWQSQWAVRIASRNSRFGVLGLAGLGLAGLGLAGLGLAGLGLAGLGLAGVGSLRPFAICCEVGNNAASPSMEDEYGEPSSSVNRARCAVAARTEICCPTNVRTTSSSGSTAPGTRIPGVSVTNGARTGSAIRAESTASGSESRSRSRLMRATAGTTSAKELSSRFAVTFHRSAAGLVELATPAWAAGLACPVRIAGRAWTARLTGCARAVEFAWPAPVVAPASPFLDAKLAELPWDASTTRRGKFDLSSRLAVVVPNAGVALARISTAAGP